MKRRGFTTTELLVVLLIILILTGIMMPAIMQTKAQAKETICISNLKQIGHGLELYHSDWDEYPWQGNRPLVKYVGADLKCPLINVDNLYSNYVVTANLLPLTEIWEGERLDYRRDLLECRERRQGDMPLVTDENHLPRIIRADNELSGKAFVYRANGSVSIVSRKRHAEVMNAMSGGNVSVPCHRRYHGWNL